MPRGNTIIHPTDIPIAPPHKIDSKHKIIHSETVLTAGAWKNTASFHGCRDKPVHISAKKPINAKNPNAHFQTHNIKDEVVATYKVGKFLVQHMKKSKIRNDANRLAGETYAPIHGAKESKIKREAYFHRKLIRSQNKADENLAKQRNGRRSRSPNTLKQQDLERSATAKFGTRSHRLDYRKSNKKIIPIKNTIQTAIDLTSSDFRQKASTFQEREIILEQMAYSEENFDEENGPILPAEASQMEIDTKAEVGDLLPTNWIAVVRNPTVSSFFSCSSTSVIKHFCIPQK